MRRLLFALMIIVAIFSIAGVGGSLAYFSDSEVSTANSLRLGVWDLDSDSGTLSVANLVAGQTGSTTWTVTNNGTIDAYLDLVNIGYTETTGATNAAEITDEVPPGTDTAQLRNFLMVHMFVDYNGNGIFNGADENIYGSAGSPAVISDIASEYTTLNLLLHPNVSIYISVNWNIPAGTDDRIYGDGLTLTVHYDLKAQP